MDQDNYTEISLVDLFAYFVKKFWVLLIGALVGMAVILSFHYISSNSAKKVEAYEKSLTKYKVELLSLESILNNLNLKLDFANEVESISPFFSDDQVYVSRIMIAVDSFLASDSESASNAVGQEISSFWNSLDLASTVGSDLENDLLKASIIFERAGQSASIKVYAEEKRIAENYASSIVNAFASYYDSREHLSIGSKTVITSIASKYEIVKIRDQFISEKTNLQAKIFDTEAEIKTLKKEAPSKYHPLKNAVIGFFAGGIIVALILGIFFVSSNPITSSFSAEKELGIPFLGALFIENKFFSRLARRIIGERAFKNKDEAIEYVNGSFNSNSFKVADKKQTIVIITSLKDIEVDKRAGEIESILKEACFESTYIGNSSENPLTIKTIEDNDSVILLVRQWNSKMQLTKMNKNLANKMGKKVLGFIIC